MNHHPCLGIWDIFSVLVSALDYPLFAFSSLGVCVAARNIANDERIKLQSNTVLKGKGRMPKARCPNLESQLSRLTLDEKMSTDLL